MTSYPQVHVIGWNNILTYKALLVNTFKMLFPFIQLSSVLYTCAGPLAFWTIDCFLYSYIYETEFIPKFIKNERIKPFGFHVPKVFFKFIWLSNILALSEREFKVISQTRRAHSIWYLRFHYRSYLKLMKVRYIDDVLSINNQNFDNCIACI